ncbi:MAG: hypothetical protein IKB08_03660 [Clostridia bacterium]|nr:hypothetical protein [Clostridia bacterium]
MHFALCIYTPHGGVYRSGKHPRELTPKELSQIAEEACTIASLSTEKQGGML